MPQEEIEIKEQYECSTCKSQDIEIQMWVNPNTNKVKDTIFGEDNDCWCNNCESHTTLKLVRSE